MAGGRNDYESEGIREVGEARSATGGNPGRPGETRVTAKFRQNPQFVNPDPSAAGRLRLALFRARGCAPDRAQSLRCGLKCPTPPELGAPQRRPAWRAARRLSPPRAREDPPPLLRREGWRVNVKRVYRLYAEILSGTRIGLQGSALRRSPHGEHQGPHKDFHPDGVFGNDTVYMDSTVAPNTRDAA